MKSYYCVCQEKKLPNGIKCRCIHVKNVNEVFAYPAKRSSTFDEGSWNDAINTAQTIVRNSKHLSDDQKYKVMDEIREGMITHIITNETEQKRK